MSNVVGLNGAPVPRAGEPRPEVVERLERLLEMARSGEIQGVGAAVLYRDDSTQVFAVGLATRGMLGAVTMLQIDVAHSLVEGGA